MNRIYLWFKIFHTKLKVINKIHYRSINQVDMLIWWDEGSKEMINTYVARDLNLTTAIFNFNTINLNQKIIYLF